MRDNVLMGTVDTYVKLAERPNTHRSYASAVQHFEVEGRGVLPASADAIAAYLAQYAGSHSISTLRARLAGLSRWHQDHGFIDPTKAPLVARVLKGIRAAHNAPQKQARPIEFALLKQVSDWLKAELNHLEPSDPKYLRTARDQAMLLIGFWRGFRSDELTRLQFEHISVKEGTGMQCFLPYSKGDRESAGRTFLCPALSKLCPVTAFLLWQRTLGMNMGPVFRGIDQWGNVSERGMAAGSVVPWLRGLFEAAGVSNHDAYSSHSLRRGFATWAKSSGWELKELMAYVGWTDVNSALRYLDLSEEDLSTRFEGLMEKNPSSKPPSIDSERPRSDEPVQPASNVVALPRRLSK